MQQIKTVSSLRQQVLAWRTSGLRVGLVPTMGYWHEGHLSLLRLARPRCDVLVASIFVNPTQFAPGEDFEHYPSDLARDAALAEDCGVDALFCPTVEDVYARDHGTWIELPEMVRFLCGASRPTHFRGVATVVCKLFQLVQPDLAVFGEKDWQQLALIRKMVQDLFLPVQIEGHPIVREADGLAMSSRNAYLTFEERSVAPHIRKGLLKLRAQMAAGEKDLQKLRQKVLEYYAHHLPEGRLDYLELVDPESIQPVENLQGRTLVAVAMYLGKARLLDNILLE